MKASRARFSGLAAFLVGTIAASGARADARQECISAADQGQQLRDDGKYRRAREEFMTCSRDVCPGPIKRDCLQWLSDIEGLSPTVVFGASGDGKDLTDVKVSLDGVTVASRLDGKPFGVDPGEHTFRFERDGKVREEKVVVRAGEKGRSITVSFNEAAPTPPAKPAAAITSPPPPKAEAGSLAPAIIAGSIGGVALGSFALFALMGTGEVGDLDRCKPNCAQADVDKAKTKLLVADISLGVSVVALGVATYLVLTRPKVDAPLTGRTSPPRSSRWQFDVGALPGGGSAVVGTSF